MAPAAAWEDYLHHGSREGRAPCPFFSPVWYRARYPDVALAGQEPLLHWLAHGWREGRSPCGLFASDMMAGDGAAAEAGEPLSRWLSAGRAAGIRPHRDLPAFDPSRPDIGLVMVWQDDSHALDLSLWSLARAQAQDGMPLTVYLVHGAGSTAGAALDEPLRRMRDAGLRIRRLAQPHGASFGARANAGIWAALQEGRHTHIGLVEQTCVIPAGVLRGLVDLWAPVAGPVLNTAAGSQCVPVDFDIYNCAEPLRAIEAFVARRQGLLTAAVAFEPAPAPAFVLFAAGVLGLAGAMCETAAEPARALAPVLAAIARAGFGPPAIARNLYVHRLERSPVVTGGTAGTAIPNSPSALPVGFTATADWALGLQASAAADRAALRGWNAAAPDFIAVHEARTLAAGDALRREADRLRARAARGVSSARDGEFGPSEAMCPWDEIATGDPPRPPRRHDPASYRATYRMVQQRAWRALVAADLATGQAFTGVQPLVAVLAALFTAGRPVLVLTMDTDPVTGDEKDGYVQRVVAIDKALADQNRLYLKMVEARRNRPALVYLEEGIWRLEIAHKDFLGEAILETVLGLGACVYSQSLVGIDPPAVRRLLPLRTGPFIMDMHGAVPEEFVLYQNHYMAQRYEKFEDWATAEADLVVCVTDAMAAHFRQKRRIEPARLSVCPVYLHARERGELERPYNLRPRAIYAGGTQRWQMIPELAGLVAATLARCDWVLLTPDIEGMARALRRAGVPEEAEGLTLRSACQSQVFDTYMRCDFGLLLREDCVVNRVACPTKLIEYLRFGVVPVLGMTAVGDFPAMGMKSVDAAAFRAGLLPDPRERARLAAENREVFARLVARSVAGRARLAQIAREGLVPSAAPTDERLRSYA